MVSDAVAVSIWQKNVLPRTLFSSSAWHKCGRQLILFRAQNCPLFSIAVNVHIRSAMWPLSRVEKFPLFRGFQCTNFRENDQHWVYTVEVKKKFPFRLRTTVVLRCCV